MDEVSIRTPDGVFTRHQGVWYDQDFVAVSLDHAARLEATIAERFAAEDDAVIDLQQRLEKARTLRDQREFHRAERLVRRVLEGAPGHRGALAILCSILRKLGNPVGVLKEVEGLDAGGYEPLITCIAAAHCDLGLHQEAWDQIRGIKGEYALELRKRIHGESKGVVGWPED